jgi:hypothetical protein
LEGAVDFLEKRRQGLLKRVIAVDTAEPAVLGDVLVCVAAGWTRGSRVCGAERYRGPARDRYSGHLQAQAEIVRLALFGRALRANVNLGHLTLDDLGIPDGREVALAYLAKHPFLQSLAYSEEYVPAIIVEKGLSTP